jgi:hypothetical protein
MDTARYYIVTLMVALGAAGIWMGGGWAWAGMATFPVLLALDLILTPDHASRSVRSRVLVNVPVYLHVPLLVTLWVAFLWRLSQWHEGALALSGGEIAGMILSVGFLGAVPNVPAVHELMHRRHPIPRALSKIGTTFMMDPNRDVGHRLTHHLELCTPQDSDTPARGQTIYGFMWQASYGAWKDGITVSLMALRKRDLSIFHWKNALYVELGLFGALIAVTTAVSGWGGLAVTVGALLFAKLLAEGFNYLQHYGMVRVPGAPVRVHHAWNHLGAIMRPVGLEITNHIDHHFDSRHQFYELAPRLDGAQMPSGFLCFVAALVPPVWERYIAKPRLRHWDEHFASPAERRMAMEQNARIGWPIWVDVPSEAGPTPVATV